MKTFFQTFFVYFSLLSFAFAQVPGTPFPIKKGEAAPADGIFLFTTDAAKLVGKLQALDEKCDATVDAAVGKAIAPLTFKIKLCNDQTIFNKGLFDAKLAAKDEYIHQLEKRVSDPGVSRSWVLMGGLVLGVLLTIGAGVAMNNAAAN